MHFLRPFAPLEVLNTHLCSAASPAPGNQGFHGCLEFLVAQTQWHSRASTVWDNEHFHFIDASGCHHKYKKENLLPLPLRVLKILILNLKAFTIECHGSLSPKVLCSNILFCIQMYCGVLHFRQLKKVPSLTVKVASFLFAEVNLKNCNLRAEELDYLVDILVSY